MTKAGAADADDDATRTAAEAEAVAAVTIVDTTAETAAASFRPISLEAFAIPVHSWC